MSVRLACIYADHYCYCNRGLNGIEGSLSVAVGASLARKEEKVYCVIGDLSFLYDQNALWQQQTGGNLRILLLNNSQGGIFRNLRGLDKSTARDTLVSARHNVDSVEGTCRQYGVTYLRATDAETLAEGLQKLCGMESRCPVLLEVKTDVDKDEQVFKSYYHKFRI
jgi:2-succinyl-5-enolpyruvyl-6-hydroxy-3-cyclohexene-1-carboxylate synthase